MQESVHAQSKAPDPPKDRCESLYGSVLQYIQLWLMFTPVKDRSLDCLKTEPVMSQSSDRQRREQTGSIWSNFHKGKEEEEGETQMEEGRDAETDLASAYCSSSAESLHHLTAEHTTAARGAVL